MKNLLFILFVAALAPAGFGQNRKPIDLGIGFVISTNPYEYYNGSHFKGFLASGDDTKKWEGDRIFPFFYKPDYGLYHFICLEKSNDYYKILINDSAIAYIPNDTNFYFKSWESMVINTTFERFSRENHIYSEASMDSEIIQNVCKYDRLFVEEIIEKKGEYWAYVSFSPECKLVPGKGVGKLKYGWVKWRTKKKLLVEILLLC